MALADLLREAEAEPGLDVLPGWRMLAAVLMELEVEQPQGAPAYNRA